MDLRGKRILMVSPESWGTMRLSKHHYATTACSKGATVYFLGPDVPNLRDILVGETQQDGPIVVKRPPPIKGIRFLPRQLRAWLETVQLRALAEACDGRFDLLWNFDLYRFRSLTSRDSAAIRLLHVMDLNEPKDLLEPAFNSDGLVVVSPDMMRGLKGSHPPRLQIPHGVWEPRKVGPPIELASHPRLGYLGNLGMNAIHWPSLLGIARAHPEAQLYLMGEIAGAFGNKSRIDPTILSQLRELPNVHLTGAIPYDQVHSWLRAMDVLLIAYDMSDSRSEATSSHKLLEYLRSGKVVLSSYLKDHSDLGDLLIMADPGRSIGELIGMVLRDLPKLNTPALMRKRTAFAMSMSYDNHMGTIQNFLDLISPPDRID